MNGTNLHETGVRQMGRVEGGRGGERNKERKRRSGGQRGGSGEGQTQG